MRQVRLEVTMDVQLDVSEECTDQQLEEIIHEDIRLTSNTSLVDVTDYSVTSYTGNIYSKPKERLC